MDKSASAVWKGSLKEGAGTISVQSGIFEGASYSFAKRFETEAGTNPEELIAAAHASCFSMAFSAELGKNGLTPESIETTATVSLETVDGKPTVSKSHLQVRAHVPGADADQVTAAGNAAKAGCPISRLLNAEITLDLTVA